MTNNCKLLSVSWCNANYEEAREIIHNKGPEGVKNTTFLGLLDVRMGRDLEVKWKCQLFQFRTSMKL